jgi:hypothetical protein
VDVPFPPSGARSVYVNVRAEFAVVSVAAVLDMRGRVVRDARLALGDVAPKPWREPPIPTPDEDTAGETMFNKRLDPVASQALGEQVVGGGVVLPKGGAKAHLAHGARSGAAGVSGLFSGGPGHIWQQGGQQSQGVRLFPRMWLTAGPGTLALFELAGTTRPWLGETVFRVPLREVTGFTLRPRLLSYRLTLALGGTAELQLEVQRGVGSKRQMDRIAALLSR